ncbi:MAG: hypothetical protein AAFX78_16285 [Cyanobacteria bacterium J06638_20]
MTAITPSSDIPSSISTLEQLSAWTLLALQDINGDLLIQEAANAPSELAIAANPYRIVVDPSDYHTRLLTRASIRLEDDWFTKKLWLAVQEFSADALPAKFRVV